MSAPLSHTYLAVITKADSSEFDARFVMSAGSPDRVADTIDPVAYDKVAAKTQKLIALFNHDPDRIAGYWTNIKRQGDTLTGLIKFASTSLGQMLKTLVEDGVPLGASIGFTARGEPNKMGGTHFKEIDLMETSVVSVPMHPRAVLLAKSFGIDLSSEVEASATSRRSAAALANALAAISPPPPEVKIMTLAEQVKAAEAAELGLKDQLVEAVKKLDETPDDEAAIATVGTLTDQVNKSGERLNSLRNAEKALAARAISAPAVIKADHLESKAPKQAGDILVKHAVCALLAYGERKSVQQVMDERYKDQPYVKAAYDFVTKTAVPPAMTTVATWAAELTRTDTRGFIDTVKDVSVAAALASRAVSLDFGGFHSVKIPRKNPLAATLTEPAWVGEGGVIPLTRFSFSSLELFRYKLAAICPFTREIFERSTPAIEGILRESLREAYAEVLDAALLSSGAGVAGVRPPGLLNGLVSLTPTAGGGEDAVRGDIMKLVTALTTARLGAKPVLLLNNIDVLSVSMMTSALSEPLFRAELAAGNLLGIPVIASANVPQHTAVIVDAAYLATAFDAPEFDISEQATIVEANADGTAPTQAGADATGGALGTAGQVPVSGGIRVVGGAGASTTGYTARSLWQTWSLAIRMVAPTSWGLMQAGAVAYIAPTTWS